MLLSFIQNLWKERKVKVKCQQWVKMNSPQCCKWCMGRGITEKLFLFSKHSSNQTFMFVRECFDETSLWTNLSAKTSMCIHVCAELAGRGGECSWIPLQLDIHHSVQNSIGAIHHLQLGESPSPPFDINSKKQALWKRECNSSKPEV